MKRLLLKILPFLPIIIVSFLSILVAIAAHQPGTTLSGWDTLHPEFNLKLYFTRILWGAWQEHQGLGAVAAQAHLAELPRIPLIWLLKTLVGTSLVRYVFILGMYVLGGISTYWYIRYVWLREKTGLIPEFSASLGALLYLFNLGTLQQFHVPLEMFAVHFATFGFILGSLHLFILTGKKKYAIFFIIVQIFSAPAAHTATLFYVYTGLLFGYGFLLCLTQKKQVVTHLKRFLLTVLLVIVAHAYWMGPNLYYVFNNSPEITEAKINRNFSDEAFWQNQAFGGIKNIAIFKNFLFNWKVYNYETQKFDDMFEQWDFHLKQLEPTWNYALATIFLLGIFLSFTSKRKQKWPLLSIFLLGFLFLNNLNQPSQTVYTVIISLSDTLKEALRFPFTKFSIVFMFAASVYFAEFCEFLFQTISKIRQKNFQKIMTVLALSAVTFGIVYPAKPLLAGGLVSDKVQVKIPQEYFELFEWFETKPESQRIALFPVIDFWPWVYYDWSEQTQSNQSQNTGYQGGGFLWFGLKQPLLNREFDRWMPQNEYFLHEMFAAIHTNNQQQFAQILEKYAVEWLIYDENVFDPQDRQRNNAQDINKNTQAEIFSTFIEQQKNISLEKSFGNIRVYFVDLPNRNESTTVEKIGSNQKKVTKDIAYNLLGNYISDTSFNRNYIFANLYNERTAELATKENNSWYIKTQVSGFEKLVTPHWNTTKSYLPVQVTGQQQQIDNTDTLHITITSILPKISTITNTYPLQNLAQSQHITVPVQLAFEDEYYQVDIDKQTTVFDPTNSSEQDLGVGFVTPDQDLILLISASYDQRTQSVVIPKAELRSLFPQQTEIPLTENDSISIVYSEQEASKLAHSFNPKQSYFEQNCAEQGSVTFTDSQNSRTFFAVDGGIACQGFLLNNLPSSDGYLLHMDIQHNSGPGIYVQTNEMGKTKIFLQETPKQDSLGTTYGLFPQNNNDLSFVIVNRSFGSFAAENTLNSLELLPLPFEYLAKIAAVHTPPVTVTTHATETTANTTKIVKILKPKSTDWYSVLLTNEYEPGIIVLEQSLDKGWIAISLNSLSKLPQYTYNSWANAWEVTEKDAHIIVFFWPQLLVWAGLGMLVAGMIFLVQYKKKVPKPRKSVNWKKIRAVFHAK